MRPDQASLPGPEWPQAARTAPPAASRCDAKGHHRKKGKGPLLHLVQRDGVVVTEPCHREDRP